MAESVHKSIGLAGFGRHDSHLPDAAQVMIIWDAVLADSSTMRLVDYIAVSMLLYVKANVLAMDDTCAVMARLMKYPPVENIHVIIQNALAGKLHNQHAIR